MSLPASREQLVHRASMATLASTALAGGIATLIHWTAPVRQPMDLVIPPTVCVVFVGLMLALMRHPTHVVTIMRAGLLAGLLALVAPAWFYLWQAIHVPGVQLVAIYPPVAALFLALMVMVMIFLPPRGALVVMVSGWLLVALPVLAYLFGHPAELHTPRGTDLVMAYGPVFVLVAVLLPVQRLLGGRIRHLVSEHARMEIMANRDPLTGLYNRHFGEHVLRDMLDRQAPGGVIMFDMDRFKAINDTHGHPVGDVVLQRVAHRCQELLRKDECIARWGGEEFVVAVPSVDASSLHTLAERLRAAIAELVVPPVPAISASLGVTLIDPCDGFDSLLQRVDKALYRAKQRGGNVVV